MLSPYVRITCTQVFIDAPTFSIATFGVTTLNITTLSIMKYVVQCHHYDQCSYAQRRYSECHGTLSLGVCIQI
jgi:hypothetical protein